jgi:lactoylglutathione lyase
MNSTYNHTGLVVADLARATRFYQEVFGFQPWYEIRTSDAVSAKLLGLTPPLDATVSFLTLDGFVLDLTHYAAQGATGPFRARPMNEPGLSHLSISVDDIHVTARKAVGYGGQIMETTDIGNALFIRDPDGQLVELLPSSYRDRLPPKP